MPCLCLHGINSALLFSNTEDKTFKVILRASTNIVMPILLPDLTAFSELVTHMAQEEIQIFLTLVCISRRTTMEGESLGYKLTCGKAVLKVRYRSSTVGFIGAFVIFELKRSRYLRMYAKSSLGFNSQPDSIWPAMILVGFRASIKSNVKYQACKMAGVSISSTLEYETNINTVH